MSRKDRKNRVCVLANKWVKIVRSGKEWSKDDLMYLFMEFCKEHKIDRPQDKTLQIQILLMAEEYLKGES